MFRTGDNQPITVTNSTAREERKEGEREKGRERGGGRRRKGEDESCVTAAIQRTPPVGEDPVLKPFSSLLSFSF